MARRRTPTAAPVDVEPIIAPPRELRPPCRVEDLIPAASVDLDVTGLARAGVDELMAHIEAAAWCRHRDRIHAWANEHELDHRSSDVVRWLSPRPIFDDPGAYAHALAVRLRSR